MTCMPQFIHLKMQLKNLKKKNNDFSLMKGTFSLGAAITIGCAFFTLTAGTLVSSGLKFDSDWFYTKNTIHAYYKIKLFKNQETYKQAIFNLHGRDLIFKFTVTLKKASFKPIWSPLSYSTELYQVSHIVITTPAVVGALISLVNSLCKCNEHIIPLQTAQIKKHHKMHCF